MREKRFEGLDVVVTGGTGALGSEVVGSLRDAGARCHVTCVDQDELDRFAHRTDEGVYATMIDLTDPIEVERYYADLPPIWASIHTAGGFAMCPFESSELDHFSTMWRTNALTCILCCREAIKKMRAHASETPHAGAGRIVNVAARPALEPRSGAGMVAYTVSKAAVAAMTSALAEEVASEGILVNAVVPSIMDTPANRAAMPNADYTDWSPPEAVAQTVLFLASPANTVTRGGMVPV